jgi:hypothetical protein
MDRPVAPHAAERVGQGAATMRDDERDARKPREPAREEQPRHRERRIGQAADRVQGIAPGQPLVAADEDRMKEDRRAVRRGDLPERVEEPE